MHTIAIDDEPQALAVIQKLAEKVPFLSLQATFTDALEALDYLRQQPVDLVLLDINMPDISGLDWVRGLTDPPLIIFTTAFSEYAAESYELEAVDYLLKPIPFNRFLKAANRAARLHQEQRPEYTFVKSGHQYVRIDFAKLLYVQGAANYVDFFTLNQRVTVRMKLSEVTDILPEEFVQIHRSFLVNLKQIAKVEHNHVWLGETSLAIGKAYRDGFYQALGKSG
ncbi:MAG: LytTR family DNA-binding domain-containing protein [Bacteroidota bacterium]